MQHDWWAYNVTNRNRAVIAIWIWTRLEKFWITVRKYSELGVFAICIDFISFAAIILLFTLNTHSYCPVYIFVNDVIMRVGFFSANVSRRVAVCYPQFVLEYLIAMAEYSSEQMESTFYCSKLFIQVLINESIGSTQNIPHHSSAPLQTCFLLHRLIAPCSPAPDANPVCC